MAKIIIDHNAEPDKHPPCQATVTTRQHAYNFQRSQNEPPIHKSLSQTKGFILSTILLKLILLKNPTEPRFTNEHQPLLMQSAVNVLLVTLILLHIYHSFVVAFLFSLLVRLLFWSAVSLA